MIASTMNGCILRLKKAPMVNMQELPEVCRPTELLELLKVEKVLQTYFQSKIQGMFRIILWSLGRLLVLKRNTVILNPYSESSFRQVNYTHSCFFFHNGLSS